jgi:hypothetical protein
VDQSRLFKNISNLSLSVPNLFQYLVGVLVYFGRRNVCGLVAFVPDWAPDIFDTVSFLNNIKLFGDRVCKGFLDAVHLPTRYAFLLQDFERLVAGQFG